MPKITITTTCGVETCDGCALRIRSLVFDQDYLDSCFKFKTGLLHTVDGVRRCPACLTEHGKGEFIAELNDRLAKANLDMHVMEADDRQRKQDLASKNPVYGDQHDPA